LLQNLNNVATDIQRNSYIRALDTVDNYISHTGADVPAKPGQDIAFYSFIITVFT
jgi:hypothetical protein